MKYHLFSQIDNAFNGIGVPRNELGSSQLQNVLSFVFVIAGIIAVIMILVASFQYITSTGDPQKTKKAKDTIIYALIGLVVSISASVIVNFVLGGV